MTDIAVQAMEALHNCRCCLRRPPDKGLKTMYESVGKTEVYWEMLKQCFDIRLNLGNDECGICEVCVNRLRDANDFKNQVQQSQVDLKSLLERALAEKDKKPSIVKVEIVEEDPISAEPLIRQDPKKEFKSESDGDLVSRLLFTAPTPAAADLVSESEAEDEPNKCQECDKTFDNEESLKRHKFAVHAKDEIPVPTEIIHTCKFCCQWFTEKSKLLRHMEVHKVSPNETIDGPYSCDICDKHFAEEAHLKEHEQDHTVYRTHRLPSTESIGDDHDIHDDGYDRDNSPLSHLVARREKKGIKKKDKGSSCKLCKEHEPKKSYPCDLCDKSFRSSNGLKSHMMGHTGERPHVCQVCQKAFKHKSHLKFHLQIHNENRQYPYSCEVCGKRFTYKSALTGHLRSHTGEKPYSCDLCKKKFALKSTLNAHLRYHRGEKPFSCDICKKSFAFRYTLQAHERFHAGIKEHQCHICQKQFTLKRTLDKHLLSHTEMGMPGHGRPEESFCCEVCGRRFRQKSYLARHLKGHMGVKPHACDVCNKRFTEKSSLKAHKKIHTGDKPYCCEICRKRFGLKATLKNHMVVHTGQKPHACRICHKQFSYKCALTVHLKSVHFRERPHTCHICKRTFALISTLKIHILSHTGVKPFSCHICGKSFAVKYALKKHLATHSGGNSSNNRANAVNRATSHYRPFLTHPMN
ncbi:oocyte zinc finger protein XlCOF6-like isoform X1 [Cydia pomonella]|uniref:oocyte zinc finger protein XlCOF6-like isoform X1 n=1 Tax=Cydia pomonella TaxID=82600 RepID=UPI002ADDED60|nr:oocyte zinc finger protein XlCOF6-like isoform X1 [Cydia pomonella]